MSEPKHIVSEYRHSKTVLPSPLYVLELCSQPGTTLLFLLEPSAQRSHLLLSLNLYVICHDHSCLQVSLETPPFLCLILKHTCIHNNTVRCAESNWHSANEN